MRELNNIQGKILKVIQDSFFEDETCIIDDDFILNKLNNKESIHIIKVLDVVKVVDYLQDGGYRNIDIKIDENNKIVLKLSKMPGCLSFPDKEKRRKYEESIKVEPVRKVQIIHARRHKDIPSNNKKSKKKKISEYDEYDILANDGYTKSYGRVVNLYRAKRQ